jgi:hypothetical protein
MQKRPVDAHDESAVTSRNLGVCLLRCRGYVTKDYRAIPNPPFECLHCGLETGHQRSLSPS